MIYSVTDDFKRNEVLIRLFVLSQKRPVPSDSQERQALKRQRLVDQPTVNGLLNHNGHDAAAPSLHLGFHSKTDFQQTSTPTANQNGLPEGQNGFPLMHKLSSGSEARGSENTEQETKASDHQPPPQSDSDCAHRQLASSQHRKKKSKKHKDKERERLKDKGSVWCETSPDLKRKPDKLDSKALFFFFIQRLSM